MSERVVLDNESLMEVKRGFVPMPGGQTEPVAGAGMMTAAQAAPMGGMPAGGDPAMGGMPMDPAAMGGMPPGGDPAMGGMPMDPAAMGGMPMDPAAMGGEMAPADGQVSMPFSQLLELIAVLTGGSVEKAKAAGGEEGGGETAEGKPKKLSTGAMVAQLYENSMGQSAGGAPAPVPAPM